MAARNDETWLFVVEWFDPMPRLKKSYSSNQPSRPDVAERSTSAGKISLTEASDQTTPQQKAMFHHFAQPSLLFFVRVYFCSHFLIDTQAPMNLNSQS